MPQPTRGKQIEAGLRWQPPGKNLMLNAAIYQINQTNVLTPALPSCDNTGTKSVQTGEVRSRGIELSATGKVTRNLSVIASYVSGREEREGQRRVAEQLAGRHSAPAPDGVARDRLTWTRGRSRASASAAAFATRARRPVGPTTR